MLMPTASRTTYNLSITAASLRPELARIVAECYQKTGDWKATKEQILASNALQCRSKRSAIRLEQELRWRLQTLTPEQIAVLAEATAEDRAAIAWLSVCKHSEFAFDFAAQVLREKLAVRDHILRLSDYETFLETESVSHPELSTLAVSSKVKIRQVLLKMLREAGLLQKGNSLGFIQRPVLSPEVIHVIRMDSGHWLAGFLVPNSEIGGL